MRWSFFTLNSIRHTEESDNQPGERSEPRLFGFLRCLPSLCWPTILSNLSRSERERERELPKVKSSSLLNEVAQWPLDEKRKGFLWVVLMMMIVGEERGVIWCSYPSIRGTSCRSWETTRACSSGDMTRPPLAPDPDPLPDMLVDAQMINKVRRKTTKQPKKNQCCRRNFKPRKNTKKIQYRKVAQKKIVRVAFLGFSAAIVGMPNDFCD